MQFGTEDRKELWITVTTNVDPENATIALVIDDTEHDCTWDDDATEVSTGRWQRTAHTDAAFAGPDVAAGEVASATVLELGHHEVAALVRVGGRILSASPPGFTVR